MCVLWQTITITTLLLYVFKIPQKISLVGCDILLIRIFDYFDAHFFFLFEGFIGTNLSYVQNWSAETHFKNTFFDSFCTVHFFYVV